MSVMVTAVACSALLILTVAATRVISRLTAQAAESSGPHSYDTPPTARNNRGKPSSNPRRRPPPRPEAAGTTLPTRAVGSLQDGEVVDCAPAPFDQEEGRVVAGAAAPLPLEGMGE